MNYFIIVNGVQEGPFPIEELAEHGLRSETLVWAEGMADWQPAWKVEELRPLLRSINTSTPPPPPVNGGTTASGDKNPDNSGAPTNGPVPNQNTAYNGTNQNQQGGAETASQGGAGTTGAANTAAYAQSAAGAYAQSATGAYAQSANAAYAQSPMQPAPQPKKHRTGILVTIAVILVLLFLAVTNPSEQTHRNTVRQHVADAIEQSISNSTDDGFFSQIMGSVGRMVALSVLNEGLDSMLEYHNYLVCSKTTFTFNGKTHMASFGILGHVFTADEDDLSKKIGDTMTVTREQHIYEGPDPQTSDDSAMDNPMPSETDSLGNLPSRIGSRISSAIAEEVSKEVKKQIDENTDSATRSGIGQIFDELEKLFK